MFVTGIWCFLLNRSITPSLNWVVRVFMYLMLGASLTFLAVYALGELVTWLSSKIRFLPAVKTLQTRAQVRRVEHYPLFFLTALSRLSQFWPAALLRAFCSALSSAGKSWRCRPGLMRRRLRCLSPRTR